MIKVQIGDIFESEAQTLVNTVNCVGVMGKGIALEFKKRFPDMFEDYKARCDRDEVKLGMPYIYKRTVPPWIINFPTKDHWRSMARVEDIRMGLDNLLEHYQEWGIKSLAMPPLGSGLGQLEWRIVGPLLYEYLSKMQIDTYLYAPYGTPTDELELAFLASPDPAQMRLRSPRHSWIDAAWVALVEILSRVKAQPYHWPIGRTIFQKMAYVAQHEGLPLGLEYRRSSYGPFAPDLKKMLGRLINNGLIEEHREGRLFAVEVGSQFERAARSYGDEIREWEPLIEKVARLFMRTNTRQSEVLSTVLFAADELSSTQEVQPSEIDVLKSVLEWKLLRRPQLDEFEVATTIRTLAALDWLLVEESSDLPISEDALMDVWSHEGNYAG